MAQNKFTSSPYDDVASDGPRFVEIPASEVAAPPAMPTIKAAPTQGLPPVATSATRSSLKDYAIRRAQELGVDPNLAMSIILQESGGNPNVGNSPKGAVGPGQVMPATYKQMMGTSEGQNNPYNSVEAGLRYLRYGQQTLKTSDPALLAAGYHAGYGRSELRRGEVPDASDGMINTRDYAKNVVSRMGGAQKVSADPVADLNKAEPGRFQVIAQPDDFLADLNKAEPGRYSVVSSLDGQDDAAAKQKAADDKPLFGYLTDNAVEGFGNMTQSLAMARWAVGGGEEEALADKLAQDYADRAKKVKSTGEKEMDAAFQRVTDAQGVLDTTVAGAKALGTAITNPKALAGEVVGQAANMLPTLGLGAAGAAGGAVAGSVVPGAGTVAGAIVGGRAGMVAGTTATELGSEVQDMIGKRLQANKQPPTAQNILALLKDPDFKAEARNQGLAKGLTVAAVDQIFMGLGGKIATAPARKAATEALAEQGVDVATRAARKEALASPAGRAAMEAAKPSLAARAGAGAAAVGVDSAGEVAGEALSQQVARGEIDKGDALREGVASLGSAAAEVGAGVAIERGKQTIAAARAPIEATPKSPSTAAGPLQRATENAAAEPERATVTTPAGQVSGTVTGTSADGQVQIVSDDGEVLTFDTRDGQIQITPEAPNTPLSNALEVAAEDNAAAPAAPVEAAPVEAAAQPEAAPQPAAPVEAAKEPAAAPTPEPAPAPSTPPLDIKTMDEPALRDRMRYIADQARSNNGWSPALVKARREVEREINARAKAAEPTLDLKQPDGMQKFAPETGTLGVPRSEMPQVKSEHHGALVNHLNAKGIEHETTQVDPKTLKPTQAEYSPQKVERAKEQGNGDRSIIVSNDGHILDGHHQALAAAENGEPVKAIVLDAPVKEALTAIKEFPSTTTEGGDPKRAKAIERIAAGKAWFNDGVKAKDFIAKNGLKDTHEVVKGKGGRWDVLAKQGPLKGQAGNQMRSQDRVVSDEDIEFNRKLAAEQNAEREKDAGYKVPDDVGVALRKLGATPNSKTKETGWSMPTKVGGLGDVLVDFDPVTNEAIITAQHMGKTYNTTKATGAPAISAAVERARDGIDAGVMEMARRMAATRVKTDEKSLTNQANSTATVTGGLPDAGRSAAVEAAGVAAEPTIEHDGDTWRIVSTGAERDGKVYAHLASTTRGTKQKNGTNPRQINDWIDADKIKAAKEPTNANDNRTDGKPAVSKEVVSEQAREEAAPAAAVQPDAAPAEKVANEREIGGYPVSGLGEKALRTIVGKSSNEADKAAAQAELDKRAAPAQEEVAKRSKKPVTRRITNPDGSYYNVEVSPQYLSYEKWISDGKAVPKGMREQITADDRLNDGEAQRLLAMADSSTTTDEPKAAQAREVAATEPSPLVNAMNDLADVRARIADQGQVVDDRLLSRERQLKALVNELENEPAKPADPFANNKIFTSDAVAKARARMKEKLGRLNSGIDPEMVMDGMTVAGAYIESGTRTFAAYAKAMTEDFGDKIKPYLLSFYEAARHYPGVDSDGMSSPSSARAQHEALMLDQAEVEKSQAASKLKGKEYGNGPQKLDQPGARALEGTQPDLLQGTEQGGQAGDGAEGGGRADAPGNERPGSAGLQQPGGLGNDAGEVSPAARGSAEGRAAKPRSPSVPRNQRPAKQDPAGAERGTGSQPDLIPEDGTLAQNRSDNFIITDEDAIGEGGQKTKYRQNVAAIRLLKQLTAENRQATRDEQAVLAKYVGWGGIPQAFYRDNNEVSKGWEKEAAELKEVMTEAELSAAAASTRNAHYTSPEIVGSVWDAARHFGFQGGRVLEPSVGVGNFFGLMPTELRGASQLTGVELDHITGGIAKQLYPAANIAAPVGFQDFSAPDNYFEFAIGNPPFGQEKIYDAKRRAISGLSIHNYFFAKAVDTLKPNGVLGMVVTNRLLDSAGDKARQYMAERTEFLGAIRLPNDAFLKNAGTQVTTDIIFLRKLKEGEQPTGHDWMEVKQYKDAEGRLVPLNEYFVENPDMMLGDFGAYGSMYSPEDAALVKKPGQDTAAMLREAIAKLPKGFMDAPSAAPTVETVEPMHDVSAVKVGSVFEQGGQIFERREDMLGKQQAAPVIFASEKAKERVTGMIKVRDALTDVRRLQLNEGSKDADIEAARAALNKAYDNFVRVNGPLNADANKRVMRDDPTWPQIAALEDDFDKGITPAVAKTTGETARPPSAKKSAIFFKRTQSPYKAPTTASSAKDAMVSSLAERGRIDLDYMAGLYGRTPEQITKELEGLIYKNPVAGWESRDQYLSGNVKKKLAQAVEAAKADPAMRANVEALKAVQPADIEAVDIDVKTGAHWIPADVMVNFIHTLTEGKNGRAIYNPVNASWTLSVEAVPQSVQTQWGTDRANVLRVLEAAANQKQIVIYDKNYDGTQTLNEAATTAANEKVERVKAEWKNWIWSDDARRERLSRIYNDTFNTDVQREFDGAHLSFPGKVGNDIISLRPHQANAVWRMVQSGTTLLDHVVGAGKTFTMIAGVMEMRRMGIAKKPVLVVPNHLVGQWAVDFLKLYPGANILAATKKDFEKDNRKKLFARISTGDWDAVILAHSSFGKVEVEPEFQEDFIKQQIADMDTSISAMRAAEGKSSRNVKQIEKQKAALEQKLKRLFDTGSKDDNLYFGELGIDAVMVDEAHEFKNLGFSTGMQRVAGLGNPSGSNKAADLFMKIQATLKRTGGKNVVFATGTPISNTMAEMYTMQRYLDYGTLKDQGIAHFDAWAKTFGEVVTDWELSPSGQYKMNSRFAKFVNMPELMQRYSSFADVINRDDINRQLAAQGKKLPVPKVKGGKPENTVVERSRDQAQYIGVPTTDENGVESYPKGSLVYRAENLPKKAEKGGDNMLKIMSDARKAALDMRLIDPSYPDNPASKVNVAADRIKSLYDKWTDVKGGQLVFIDLSTPKNAKAKEAAALRELVKAAEEGDDAAQEKLDAMSPDELMALDGDFSVYDDLKAKLITKGIPANEIAFIHDAGTELQKEDLFGKVRSGRVRVLLGSTAKMGAGMNVQERLVALHHLDAPWRPSDLEQREGRIIRQGNKLYEANPEGFEIEIMRYATKQTLDSRMWQTIEAKARFIEQVRKGTGSREVEDVAGEASNSAEMKAASSGNPLILEEMTLRQNVRKLENQQAEHNREQYRIKDRMRMLGDMATRYEKQADQYEADASLPPKTFAVKIGNETFDKHGEAGEAILKAINAMFDAKKDTREIGSYGGFKLRADDTSIGLDTKAVLTVEGAGEYQVEANPGSSATGLALRLQNTVKDLAGEAEALRQRAASNRADIPRLEAQVGDWKQAKELTDSKARHAAVIEQLRPKKKPDAPAKPEGEASMAANDTTPAGWSNIDADERANLPTLDDERSQADLRLLERKLDAFDPGTFSARADKPYRAVRLPDADALAAIGDAFGVRVVGIDLNLGAAQKYDRFSGVTFKGEGNAVFLSARSTRPHLALLGHETAHQMAARRPDLYAKLVDAIAPYIKEQKYESEFVNSAVAKNVKSRDGKQEEFIGEILSDGFTEPGFWQAIGQKSPQLLRQVYSFVARLLSKVTGAYTPKTAPYLTDYQRVMQIAGEVMGEYGLDPAEVNKAAGLAFAEKAKDQTDTAEFKAWFGDSKVVDADGKPLVVYHGSSTAAGVEDGGLFVFNSAENLAGWFTPSAQKASDYATRYEAAGVEGSGPQVYPVFLSIKNPLAVPGEIQSAVKDSPKFVTLAKSIGAKLDYEGNEDFVWQALNEPGFIDAAIAAGHDGIYASESGQDTFAAFRPEQIKSAIGNNGNFDTSNPDIRFADKEPANTGLTPADQGLLRRIQSAVQDNMNRVRQVQDRIQKLTGMPMREGSDYYRAETNRPGRTAARMEDARNKLIQPLMEKLAKSGHTQEQLGELLHAQHAQERNERVASINPDMPDGGSGMLTADANAILQKYAGNDVLKKLADEARRIAKMTLEMKHAYGLIDDDTLETLRDTYENYVPLKGDGEYGPKIKRAMGHDARDEQILENIARDYDQAVVVGEKNLARQSLLSMVLQNPDSDLWTVGVPPRGRYVVGQSYKVYKGKEVVGEFQSAAQAQAWVDGRTDSAFDYTIQTERGKFTVEKNGKPAAYFTSHSKAEDYIANIKDPVGKFEIRPTGERVREFVKPLQSNEVPVYVDGRLVRVQINDETLARQLRPLDQGQMNVILETMRTVMRHLSRVYTAYSPTFIITNPLRDIQTGTINMLGSQGASVAAKAWAQYPAAVTALARFGATKKVPGGEMGRWLAEYRDNGGKTGASHMSDLEQQGKTLQRMFDDAYGVSGYLKDGKPVKASLIAGRKAIMGLAHVIEIANQASENALRLGLYVALRKGGASAGEAASAAKNVTVNFDRKGSQTNVLGALYLFINPAIQGTANAMRTLFQGQHKEQAWAALGALAALGAWAASQGLDDDKDRWLGEGFDTRGKKLVMNIGGHRIVVPLSLEFAPFYAAGVAIEEAKRGAVTNTQAAAHILSSFIDAYIPFRGLYSPDSDNRALDASMAMVPTVLLPYMQAATNRNSFGSKIVPESDFNKDRPDNLKMNRNTKGTVFDSAAQGLAAGGELMGSGRYENDWSKVSPEMLKHYWRTYTGGLGTFVADMAGLGKLAAEDASTIELADVPVAKAFVAQENVRPIRSRWYELSKDARAAATEFAEAKKAGDGKAMDDILSRPDKAEMLGLSRMITKTNAATTAIRDEMATITADAAIPLAEKRAKLKELERAEEDILRAGLQIFSR